MPTVKANVLSPMPSEIETNIDVLAGVKPLQRSKVAAANSL